MKLLSFLQSCTCALAAVLLFACAPAFAQQQRSFSIGDQPAASTKHDRRISNALEVKALRATLLLRARQDQLRQAQEQATAAAHDFDAAMGDLKQACGDKEDFDIGAYLQTLEFTCIAKADKK